LASNTLLSEEDKQKIVNGFSRFYVYEKHCNHGFCFVFGAFYFQIIFVIIMLTYILITFSSLVIVVISMGSVNVMACGILASLLHRVTLYRLASAKVIRTMKSNPSTQGDLERRQWRSVKSLELWFGGLFIVERMEYLLVVVNIITQCVVNLLLTVKIK